VVKKATPKKPAKKVEKNVGGRPRRDPDTLRTERLVLRIHPDLMAELTDIARRNGLTRSMLVERTLISMVNLEGGEPYKLDFAGRHLNYDQPPPGRSPLGTPDSFARIWSRMIGGAPAPRNPQPPGWVRPGRGDRSGNPEDDGT